MSQQPEPMAVGRRAPRFQIVGPGGGRFVFDSLAGRYVVLGFLGGSQIGRAPIAVRGMQEAARLFDGRTRTLFWISADKEDHRQARLSQDLSRIGVLWDFDYSISRAFGVVQPSPQGLAYRQSWIVLDPQLCVLANEPLGRMVEIVGLLAGLAPPPVRPPPLSSLSQPAQDLR